MDPVSVVGVVAAAAQFASLCVSICHGLNGLKDKFQEARSTVTGIRRYCTTLEIAIAKIISWIQTTLAHDPEAQIHIAALQSAIEDYNELLRNIQEDVDKIAGKGEKDAKIGVWRKAKFVWDEGSMRRHLEQLHYLQGAIHFLLDTMQLPRHQTRQAIKSLADDALSICSDSSSRAIYNYPFGKLPSSSTAEFTFNEITSSSRAYQRAEAFAAAGGDFSEIKTVGEDLETEKAWFITCEQPEEGSDRNSDDERPIKPRKRETSNGGDSSLTAIQGGLEDTALSPNQESISAITTVAFSRNRRFYGREKELALLHGNLRRPTLNALRCCVLHGIGGTGKTQIALEYTYRYREYYEYIFWIRAEDPTSLSMSYAIIAKQLKLTTSTTPEIQIEHVKEWLEHHGSHCLLVFDNVEDLDLLRIFLPKSIAYEGSIIITTQRKRVASTFQEAALLIEGLSETDGAGLLLRLMAKQETTTDAESKESMMDLSRNFGGSPLFIALVADFAANSMMSLEKIADLLHQTQSSQWISLSDRTATGLTFQYDKTLKTVFMIALEELPEQALLALYVMAFLDPDEIAEEMLFEMGNSGTSALWNNLHSFYSILQMLGERHLIKRTGTSHRTISMHRSISWSILHQFNRGNETAQVIFNKVIEILRNQIPARSQIRSCSNATLSELDKYSRHINQTRKGFELLEMRVQPSVEFGDLLRDFGACMVRGGNFTVAKEVLEAAILVFEKSRLGPAHHSVESTRRLVGFMEEWGPLD